MKQVILNYWYGISYLNVVFIKKNNDDNVFDILNLYSLKDVKPPCVGFENSLRRQPLVVISGMTLWQQDC